MNFLKNVLIALKGAVLSVPICMAIIILCLSSCGGNSDSVTPESGDPSLAKGADTDVSWQLVEGSRYDDLIGQESNREVTLAQKEALAQRYVLSKRWFKETCPEDVDLEGIWFAQLEGKFTSHDFSKLKPYWVEYPFFVRADNDLFDTIVCSFEIMMDGDKNQGVIYLRRKEQLYKTGTPYHKICSETLNNQEVNELRFIQECGVLRFYSTNIEFVIYK